MTLPRPTDVLPVRRSKKVSKRFAKQHNIPIPEKGDPELIEGTCPHCKTVVAHEDANHCHQCGEALGLVYPFVGDGVGARAAESHEPSWKRWAREHGVNL